MSLPTLVSDPAILDGYLTDASNTRGSADGLFRPTSAAEVAEIVRHCQQQAIPLTVTARRTSTTAGPIPSVTSPRASSGVTTKRLRVDNSSSFMALPLYEYWM